jgi:acetyl-CoA carboxylase biotin carboxylase subunit
MEKYLVGGRHIEFQVIGDGRGNAIHLGERECSIQRRHQKLLEEAPSPALTAEQRDYYGAISAAATAQWNYAGVGTMEYLMADDGKLYFLEMNTRLQVEHPVTECITGIDLVQAQIQIAAGGGLPCAQEDVQWNGHAIEVRLNAEDPEQDFRPAPGRIEKFDFPVEQVRVDSHLVQGSKIPPHYDSLIAKMIAHGPDRAATTSIMLDALEKTTIEGVPTTAALHQRILRSDDFQSGAFDTLWLTDFLER